MALQNQFGNLALDASVASLKLTDPDGTLQTSQDPSTLLLDSFDASLVNFTTTGTAPTVSASNATFASTTTASTVSVIRSNGAFQLRSGAYLRNADLVRYDAAAVTNATRWWGIGTNQTSPTAAAPVLNGAVFQLDYADGALYAMTYNAGTATKVATLARQTDAALHRYEIWYRQSVVYWTIDNLVVASRSMPSMAAYQSQYAIAGQVNYTTAPASAPVLVLASVSVSDSSNLNKTISDGTLPWVQASVKVGTATQASSDTALVVAQHPSSVLFPGTAATNLGKAEDAAATSGDTGVAMLGVRVDTPSTTLTTSANGDYSQVSTDGAGQVWTKPGLPLATDAGLVPFRSAAVTSAVVVKASSGRIRRIRVYNPNTSVAYLQVLNTAASPALATNLIEEFIIPASTTYAENIDIPTAMSTGISIGASTASGGTTAVTTGLNVQIWYV